MANGTIIAIDTTTVKQDCYDYSNKNEIRQECY